MYPGWNPGNAVKGETSVIDKNLNPEWNETIKCSIHGNSYKPTETLVMGIFDKDTLSGDDPSEYYASHCIPRRAAAKC